MISVLCVTKREHTVIPFLDTFPRLAKDIGGEYVEVVDGEQVHSDGTIESVLDEAIALCKGDYILRMDDDETASEAMKEWLKSGAYKDGDLFAFPRAHLWKDIRHYIAQPPLWPDLQTRLSTREKAGGRKSVHDGSPYGTGKIIDAPIIHWKFLIRNAEERREIAKKYERIKAGAGFSPVYQPFNLPELSFAKLTVKEFEDG